LPDHPAGGGSKETIMDDNQADLRDEEFDDLDDADSLFFMLAEYGSYGARQAIAPCIDAVAWSEGASV
jgi:hypothetical protein